MFEIEKKGLHFMVHLDNGLVSVVPLGNSETRHRIQSVITQNIAFLANYALKHCALKNKPLVLKNHFEDQGWQVMLPVTDRLKGGTQPFH